MTFLASGFATENSPVARGHGLVLRPYSLADHTQWATLRDQSRDHLVPWEPTWAPNELSQAAFRRRIKHYKREIRDDLGYAYAIVDDTNHRLLGGITLSNVRRGVSHAASLGYWTGAPHTRKGIMSRAVGILLPFSFDQLRLHRIEAASMPSNSASIKVLERNKFVREGFARQLLKINGVWQDHILFGLVADKVELAETKTQ